MQIDTSQQAQIVDALKRQCPGFAVMRKLVFSFRAILRGGKVTTLHRWMEEARKTGIHSLVRFVRTLKQDLSAVEAAVSEPWSNVSDAKLFANRSALFANDAESAMIACSLL